MVTFRLRRRAAAWLGLASMVLNASWPVLANAKPSAQDPQQEICSATGLSHANGGAPAESTDNRLHASHCSLCPFGAERGAAITPPVGVLLVPVTAPAQVLAREDAPHVPLALHPAAPPRAPPVVS